MKWLLAGAMAGGGNFDALQVRTSDTAGTMEFFKLPFEVSKWVYQELEDGNRCGWAPDGESLPCWGLVKVPVRQDSVWVNLVFPDGAKLTPGQKETIKFYIYQDPLRKEDEGVNDACIRLFIDSKHNKYDEKAMKRIPVLYFAPTDVKVPWLGKK